MNLVKINKGIKVYKRWRMTSDATFDKPCHLGVGVVGETEELQELAVVQVVVRHLHVAAQVEIESKR
jgi:hypothetical protein